MMLWGVLLQAAPPEVDIGSAALRALLVLGLLIGLLFVVARYGRHWFFRLVQQRQGELRVKAICALEPRRNLFLVELRDRQYLIASSEAGISLLKELPSRPADESGDDSPGQHHGNGEHSG